MASPFVQIQFYIAVEDDLLPEEVERLEDNLALVLECLGLHGEIESESTRNTTVFPDPNIRGELSQIKKMIERLHARPEPEWAKE